MEYHLADKESKFQRSSEMNIRPLYLVVLIELNKNMLSIFPFYF